MPLICLVNIHGLFQKKKNKKGTSIVNAFKRIVSKGQRKPNKTWVDESNEFYNQSFKDFLKISNIEMYSTYTMKENLLLLRDLL